MESSFDKLRMNVTVASCELVEQPNHETFILSLSKDDWRSGGFSGA